MTPPLGFGSGQICQCRGIASFCLYITETVRHALKTRCLTIINTIITKPNCQVKNHRDRPACFKIKMSHNNKSYHNKIKLSGKK